MLFLPCTSDGDMPIELAFRFLVAATGVSLLHLCKVQKLKGCSLTITRTSTVLCTGNNASQVLLTAYSGKEVDKDAGRLNDLRKGRTGLSFSQDGNTHHDILVMEAEADVLFGEALVTCSRPKKGGTLQFARWSIAVLTPEQRQK